MKQKAQITPQKYGKNRFAGKALEDRVYLDLEKKEWIVSRWMKNVENIGCVNDPKEVLFNGKSISATKLIPAKPYIRMIPGKGPILLNTWTGFPDFIVYKTAELNKQLDIKLQKEIQKINKNGGPFSVTPGKFAEGVTHMAQIMGVEVKLNGDLSKEEKEKCKWLLKNNIFSKILIAKKGKKRGSIEYNEFS